MKDHLLYKYLERASLGLLAVIGLAIGLLFFDSVPLQTFKILLLVLLTGALIIFVILRRTIRKTISAGKSRFKSAENKFRHIYESDAIGITIVNFDGRLIQANDAYLKMLGYTREELQKGQINWNKLTPPEFAEKSKDVIEELKTTGTCPPFEKQYIRKDGSRIWVLLGASLLSEDETGDVVTYVVDFTNIKEAERRTQKLQKLLIQQQEEFKSILMEAPGVITIRRGPELRYTFVNNTVRNLSGQKDFYNKTHEEVFGYLNIQDTSAKKVLQTGKPEKEMRRQIQYAGSDGKVRDRYFDFLLNPVFDADGKVDGVAVYGFDVTDLVQANQEISINRNRFAFVADSMPHKVWMGNQKAEITYLNKAWLSYANVNDIKDFDWINVIHPEEKEELSRSWALAEANIEEYTNEHRLKQHNGEYRWHLSKVYPLQDSDGTLVMWVGVNTDIHDQKVQQQELVERQELLNKKDEFLSIASHELKTPLTNIKATVQLLDKIVTNDPKASLFSSKAIQHIGRLERLIGDLLDVSKINAGALFYNKTDFNFGDVLHETVLDIQQQTASHEIIQDNNSNITINADKERIEQVLYNLISNAIKYSPGSNKVHVAADVKDDKLYVSVQDFGIGIPQNEQENLFTRYYRVNKTSVKYQGLGIGLFICKQIIKRHGGVLHVKSEVGKGSTFYFTLPV